VRWPNARQEENARAYRKDFFAKISLQPYADRMNQNPPPDPPERNDIITVRDIASLKAVAHPLRVRLLGALRINGPATASQLAREFGESSGSTSYHLRQLARYGFIEEDPEQPNARERRWRARHRYTSWRDSDFIEDPEGREAAKFMRERQRELAAATARRFEAAAEAGAWSREWIDAAGMNDFVVRLTPADLTTLIDRIKELVEEYAARSADAPDAEQVYLFLSAHPFQGHPE